MRTRTVATPAPALSASDIARYHADGFLTVRGVFSAERIAELAPNRSAQSRRLLYLSYSALSDGGDLRDKHYAEFRGWLQDRYAEYGKTSTFFR